MTPQKQLEAGIRFLLRHQDSDGAWRDFRLRPGRSDAWTTAFVAMRLLPSAHGVLRHPVGNALSLAERFLQKVREPHGGWAYNRRCPTDADSTACALLFLKAVSAIVLPKDYAALARFQLENGGFATYRFADAKHAWCVAHAEVTATSLRAMSNFLPPDHLRIRNGIAWMSQYLSLSWDNASYWWLSPRYFAIEARELRRAFPLLPSCREHPVRHDGYFDLALSSRAGHFRHRGARTLCRITGCTGGRRWLAALAYLARARSAPADGLYERPGRDGRPQFDDDGGSGFRPLRQPAAAR